VCLPAAREKQRRFLFSIRVDQADAQDAARNEPVCPHAPRGSSLGVPAQFLKALVYLLQTLVNFLKVLIHLLQVLVNLL
jgi:hypothetical protein